ncbi:hypothetical protein [Pararhodospirillum oryzae]|uniref:Uncharacterized protein n=1 Tax=Pararhodospirillum oryzae TaxID=478448 RepID=A0A512H488_9PROT|nr:hypothetical protein [Pararhodospirillum oryzae]GEO80257.1 hypothetical protein ROR02_03880 [Pararhodospirillum oryzae]
MTPFQPDFAVVRAAMASFDPSPRVSPNAAISVDQAFLPEGHRGVLDLRRQLVVGNRGMGKSFWTHALLNPEVRTRLADSYGLPLLAKTHVVVGFNGSEKINPTAPTINEMSAFMNQGVDPERLWQAVLVRIARVYLQPQAPGSLSETIDAVGADPTLYPTELSRADDALARNGETLLVVFDALEHTAPDWEGILSLTRALLALAVRLQSFRSIRAKIFMRVDQFSNQSLFRFPDSSKIRNDRVTLMWRPSELYGLLLFELRRTEASRLQLDGIARAELLPPARPEGWTTEHCQTRLINVLAGEFMGKSKKRGRVYTWVPLHLSDAAGTCSPRSFLAAWKTAAEHNPAPKDQAVDHLGLMEGVRFASESRLAELKEDYPWIEPALDALRRQLVPMERAQLFNFWSDQNTIVQIEAQASSGPRYTPVQFAGEDKLVALLSAMRDVGVMEERANGKINVPDIFRVEAKILRKGGVAVPKRAG